MRKLPLVALFLAILTAPAVAQIGTTTQSSTRGPDIVQLRELANLYEPVPFDHKSHAQMTEMWDGCTTCHHRTPTTEPSDEAYIDHKDQNDAGKVPACKTCHEIAADRADIHMPTLKGAYHRQCLNCHREWANQNSCNVCHAARNPAVATTMPATPDDIVGRMHPPIPEPDVKVYVTRFTPAVGGNVIFRHAEHVKSFGLKCINCHQHDNCDGCHGAGTKVSTQPVITPGRTWSQTHDPCTGCHQQDRCRTCHYDKDQTPPPSFEHRMVGQLMDKDHADLKCGQCHPILKAQKVISCGDATCHKPELAITYPEKRPGPVVVVAAPTTSPSTRPVVEVQTDAFGAVVKRVRRPLATTP